MRISDWSSDVCSSDLVKLLRAVKAAVDEVRRHIHQQRPFHRIRADKRNIMRAQQVDEFRRGEALMPYFHRMPDRADIIHRGPCPSLQPRVMAARSEEHTSELQSLMRISYAVFCLKKKPNTKKN